MNNSVMNKGKVIKKSGNLCERGHRKIRLVAGELLYENKPFVVITASRLLPSSPPIEKPANQQGSLILKLTASRHSHRVSPLRLPLPLAFPQSKALSEFWRIQDGEGVLIGPGRAVALKPGGEGMLLTQDDPESLRQKLRS